MRLEQQQTLLSLSLFLSLAEMPTWHLLLRGLVHLGCFCSLVFTRHQLRTEILVATDDLLTLQSPMKHQAVTVALGLALAASAVHCEAERKQFEVSALESERLVNII